jgi:hypothetical protein
MPTQRQIIVNANPAPAKPRGARNDNRIKAAFPHSPIHLGELTDDERKNLYQTLVLDGDLPDGPGNGVNSFNRDFKGTAQNPVPNLEDVVTGGGGLPASPYVPNLASPGPGSANASDQPEFAGELPVATNNNFGSGMGGLVSPSSTSPKIAEQGTLGTYISGRSYQGSDGKA